MDPPHIPQSSKSLCVNTNIGFTLSQPHLGLVHSQASIPVDSQSGSETDISTSTETLSPEERHALRHTRRQEPQGQEHVPPTLPGHPNNNISTSNNSLMRLSPARDESPHSSRNNDSNLSMSSSTNTMIIHHSVADNSWTRRWLPSSYSTPTPASRKSGGNTSSTYIEQDPELPSYSSHLRKLNTESLNMNPTLVNSSLLESSLLNASLLNTYTSNIVPKTTSFLNETGIQNSTKLSDRQEGGVGLKFLPESDLTDLQSSFLDQSEVLKHLMTKDKKGGYSDDQSASSSNSGLNILSDGTNELLGRESSQSLKGKETDYSTLLNLPPPPSYSHWQRDHEPGSADPLIPDTSQALDKTQLSRSQPDLSRLSSTSKDPTSTKDLISLRLASDTTDESERHLLEMIDVLTQENNNLKSELHTYRRRVAKLQRFELEILKVHEAHEALVKLSDHREQLERLARHKLNVEVKQLKETNSELKEQLDVLSNQITSCSFSSDSDSLRKEMNKRDVFIAQLVSQNKELIAAKERQEIELTAQRQTLNEQRTHIDILDNALTNAQTNAVKLEEEVRKKQNLVEHAGQLKRWLLSLQLSADRREHSEKNLRQKLEKEIMILRSGVKQEGNDSENGQLRRELREREEKIMVLEGEVTKWEQRYLQESAMRQLAIEAASMPKDAKIAALEKTSQESDRRIAQAKSDKLRHLDDIHNMNKKLTESQSKNKDLESRIAEKDAMIRVLQKRVEEKESLYQNAVRSSVGSSPSSRGSTSDTGGVTSSSSHIHSSSVSGSSSGVFTTPGTPRRDEDLGYYVAKVATKCYGVSNKCNPPPPIPPFPTNQIYSSASCLPTSVSATSLTSDSTTRKDINRPKTDSFCSTDVVSSRRSRPGRVGEPTRFASQDLLDSDSYQDKFGLVCFPGLADQGSSAGESQQPKPLLAAVDGGHPRPATPISVLPYPSYRKAMYPCQCNEIEVCPPHNVPCPIEQDIVTVAVAAKDPPPYHSHHTVLRNLNTPVDPSYNSQCINNNNEILMNPSNQNVEHTANLPFPNPLPICRKQHLPNMTCKTCNIVRRSNRQNAAKMLRRANSSGCQHSRISSPIASNLSMVEIDDFDSPSILANLKREWQLGGAANVSAFDQNTGACGYNTLPRSVNNIPREEGMVSFIPERPVLTEEVGKRIEKLDRHEVSEMPATCCRMNQSKTVSSDKPPMAEHTPPTKHRHSAVSHLAHLKDLATKLITQSGINNQKNTNDKLKETETHKVEILKGSEGDGEIDKVNNKEVHRLTCNENEEKLLVDIEVNNESNIKQIVENNDTELIILEDSDHLKLSQEKKIETINNLV